jgi:hypothetical protein
MRKGLLLGNYDGVEVEEYNAKNSNTNEDFMLPSNHQYVGEPTCDMLQVNNMGQLQDVEGTVTQKLVGQNCKSDSPRKHKHKKVPISERVSSTKIIIFVIKVNCRCGSKK